MDKNTNMDTYVKTFLKITLSSFALFVVMVLLTRGRIMSWLVMDKEYIYQFSDYFRHIVYASDLKNIYLNTDDASFPPFTYCFFYLLYRINPIKFGENGLENLSEAQEKNNLLIFFFFFMLICVALYWIIEQLFKGKYSVRDTRLVFFAIIVAPFVLDGALERGNTVIVAMMCILVSVFWRDSGNKVKRELALILIAIAAGLKIYPAIFGFMYIKERRWKEAARLIVYGCVIFFVPFIFTGGIAGFKAYISDLLKYEGTVIARWSSIKNYIYAIWWTFTGIKKTRLMISILEVVEIAYFIILMAAFFATGDKWKSTFYLSVLLSTFVSKSYRYMAVYMVIPLLTYFVYLEQREKRKKYLMVMSFAFSVPWYGYWLDWDADFFMYTPIYICVIMSLVEDVRMYITGAGYKA